MSEPRLLLEEPCKHGMMSSHNAFRLSDGSVVDDPEGPCPGGSRGVYDDPEQVVTMSYGESVLPFNEDDWEAGGVVRLPVRDIIEALAALEGREP